MNQHPVSSDTIFRETLRQMESSFTVSLVATFDLKAFEYDQSISHARDLMRRYDFSQAPVTRGGEIVGVVDDAVTPVGNRVGDWMQPLGGKVIIAGQSNLRSLVRQLANGTTRYRLVARDEGVTGIVTRSDLQKLPVRLLTYTYLAHLESLMADAIESRVSEEQWFNLLSNTTISLPQSARDALGPNIGRGAVDSLKSDQE